MSRPSGTRIFISYAWKDDQPFVGRLYDDLQRLGYDPRMDRKNMPSRGRTLPQEVVSKLSAHVLARDKNQLAGQGKVVAAFTADAPLLSCGVGPDGRVIVAGDALGRVHFLSLEEQSPLPPPPSTPSPRCSSSESAFPSSTHDLPLNHPNLGQAARFHTATYFAWRSAAAESVGTWRLGSRLSARSASFTCPAR